MPATATGALPPKHDRERILTLIANQLREMGFVNMHVQSLKPRHVEKLVRTLEGGRVVARDAEEPDDDLRWWAEKNGKANVVAKSNDAYGIADRRYVTNVSKARQLTSGDLAQVTDPYTRMSLRLQATFGLRRKESIKIQPAWADRGDTLMIKASWGKGRAPVRSRSAMPSNAASWMRRSALPGRAVSFRSS